MLLFGIVALIAGMALAQRFPVLILVPVIFVTLIITVGSGVIIADQPWTISVATVIAAVTLQLGYVLGATIKEPAAMRRTERSNGLSLPNPATSRRVPN